MSVINESNPSAMSDGIASKDLSEDDLKLLNKTNSLSLVESKVPVKIASKLGLKSSSQKANVLSGLIASSENESLHSLTLEDLQTHFPEPRIGLNSDSDHLVKPPLVFGSDEIPKEIIDNAIKSRKASADSISVELILREVNEIHKRNNNRFSPKALAELLKYMLGPKMLPLYFSITTKEKYTLEELFEDLSAVHGQILPLNSLISNMHSLSDNFTTIWSLASDFHDLLSRSGAHFDTLSNLMIHELLRKIRTLYGITLSVQISQALDSNPKRKDFRSLFKILKDNYKSHFEQVSKRHTAHNVVVHNVETAPTQKSMNNAKCYECGQSGHLARNCDKKQNINRPNNFNKNPKFQKSNNIQNNNIKYCDALCSIHQSSHTNKQCRAQKTPCNFKQTHSGHEMGSCQRPNYLVNNNNNNKSMQPKNSSSSQNPSSVNHIVMSRSSTRSNSPSPSISSEKSI